MDLTVNSNMIPIWRNITQSVNKKFEDDIINALDKYPDKYFDVLEAINTLEVNRVFSPEYCHQELLKFSHLYLPDREKLLVLVLDILKAPEVSLVQFCDILDLVGLSDLAEDIYCEHNGPVYRQICRAHIPHSQHLQNHFYTTKSFLDDNSFTARLDYLRHETNELKLSFARFGNENSLTRAANKFAVNTWLWVQHCKRDTQEIRRLLIDMRTISWPAVVDPILSEIVYESKMAVVSALEGSFEFAKVHRSNAKCLAREYYDPLIKTLVCHDSRYVSQILARNNVPDNTSVLRECQIALRFLESESDGNDFCKQMQRLFRLNLAQHYLLIENDLQVDRTVPVPVNYLKSAENVLKGVKTNLQSGLIVERRRNMVYKVCMARLHDANGKHNAALANLCEAEHFSRNGAFFEAEIGHIREYKAVLESS